jgi:hypothetical protein
MMQLLAALAPQYCYKRKFLLIRRKKGQKAELWFRAFLFVFRFFPILVIKKNFAFGYVFFQSAFLTAYIEPWHVNNKGTTKNGFQQKKTSGSTYSNV